MIPYDLDPSLHNAEPEPMTLEDGFSPPHPPAVTEDTPAPGPAQAGIDPALRAKSAF